jgi:hypothetical protein
MLLQAKTLLQFLLSAVPSRNCCIKVMLLQAKTLLQFLLSAVPSRNCCIKVMPLQAKTLLQFLLSAVPAVPNPKTGGTLASFKIPKLMVVYLPNATSVEFVLSYSTKLQYGGRYV